MKLLVGHFKIKYLIAKKKADLYIGFLLVQANSSYLAVNLYSLGFATNDALHSVAQKPIIFPL